jgi:hypothetical protein
MNKPTVKSVVALALNEDIGTGDVSVKCHSFRTDDSPRGARYHTEYLIFIHTIAIIQLPLNSFNNIYQQLNLNASEESARIIMDFIHE